MNGGYSRTLGIYDNYDMHRQRNGIYWPSFLDVYGPDLSSTIYVLSSSHESWCFVGHYQRIQVDGCEASYAETGEQNCQYLKLWKPQHKDCMNEPHLIVDRPATGDSLHRHCVPSRSGTSSYQTWKRKDTEQTKDGRRYADQWCVCVRQRWFS